MLSWVGAEFGNAWSRVFAHSLWQWLGQNRSEFLSTFEYRPLSAMEFTQLKVTRSFKYLKWSWLNSCWLSGLFSNQRIISTGCMQILCLNIFTMHLVRGYCVVEIRPLLSGPGLHHIKHPFYAAGYFLPVYYRGLDSNREHWLVTEAHPCASHTGASSRYWKTEESDGFDFQDGHIFQL